MQILFFTYSRLFESVATIYSSRKTSGIPRLKKLVLISTVIFGYWCIDIYASENTPTPVTDDLPSVSAWLNLNGSLRGSYWDASSNPTNSNILSVGEIWLKSVSRIFSNTTLRMEGWSRTSNGVPSTTTQSLLREGYINYSNGNADFNIGKKIQVWGRADQINPTDNLSPRDYSLLTTQSEDQLQGTTMIKVSYSFIDMELTGILLPVFHPNNLPIPHSADVYLSEIIPGGNQYAVRLEQTGQRVDWSLSYFRGFDLNPDISIQSALVTGLTLLLQHHPISVLGADASTVIGRYGLRGEVAYTWTENLDGTDPFIKKPFLYGVAGVDRTFFESFNINLQYFARRVSNFNDPNSISDPVMREVAIQQSIISNQQDAFQQGVSMRIYNKWLNNTFEAEISAIYNMTHQDYLLRPKIVYAFDDHWKGLLGGNVYRGKPNTFFGMIENLSTIFCEVRYNF